MEGAEVVVSLSLVHALSEIHPLSETPARLASKRNLGENLPHQLALNASTSSPNEIFVSSCTKCARLAEPKLTYSRLVQKWREARLRG